MVGGIVVGGGNGGGSPKPAGKLTLRRETLRPLTTGELRLVVGGRTAPRTYVCTTRSDLG